MQTSYSINQEAAQVGLLVDIGPRDIRSQVGEEKVYIGRMVTKGTEDEHVRAPSAAGDVTDIKLNRGVVVKSQYIESNDDGDDPNIASGEMVNCLRSGRVWVKVLNAVDPGDAVYVGHSGTDKGKFRGGSASNFAAMPGNAKFLTSANEGGLAQLEFSLT